jgi:hypothetical protein
VVKKSTPVGRECALVLPAASGQALELSYWDLWFTLVAVAVFEAALSPGMHEGFLRQKYEQLKKGKWSPDPRR